MKLNRKTLAIIGGLIVLVLLLSGSLPGLLSFDWEQIDTDGESFYVKGIVGNSEAICEYGDLLDAPGYVTSWTGGLSEKIFITGWVMFYADGPIGCSVERIWYVVKLSGTGAGVMINEVLGTTYTSAKYEPEGVVSDETWIPMQSILVQLRNPFEGTVTVELWADHSWDMGLSHGTDMIAKDTGVLLSGLGSVDLTEDVVEEGTNANLVVKTGYSHSFDPSYTGDEGYTLKIFQMDTGASVFSKLIADDFYGTIVWLVPDGLYSSTSPSHNTFKAVLRNELMDIYDDSLFIVGAGMIDDIPSKPTFTITDGDAPYTPGESITVKVSAIKGAFEIAGFSVWVSYETVGGQLINYVMENKWYKATQTTTGGYCYVTFTFPSTGIVRFEASAVDTMNLNSGISELTWTVYASEDDPPATSGDWDVTGLLIAVGLIVLALVIFAKAPLPEYIKWVVVLALLAVAGYFAFGVIESLNTEG
jgi:hypothetical protein